MATRIVTWAAYLVLAVVAAYQVASAVGTLTMFPAMGASAGLSVTPIGWIVLWAWVVLPVLAVAIALWATRSRGAMVRVFALLTAVAAAAALRLEFLLYEEVSTIFFA